MVGRDAGVRFAKRKVYFYLTFVCFSYLVTFFLFYFCDYFNENLEGEWEEKKNEKEQKR